MTAAVLVTLLPAAAPTKLALALAAPWGLGWHLLWQMQRLDIDRPEICLRLFRANRETGLIAALFLAAAALA
jgi:4-hydroxybenzoate polyprenyltransferase